MTTPTRITTVVGGWREPTIADLLAIEAEWPVLAAELDVVTAERRALACPGPAMARAVCRARGRLGQLLALEGMAASA